MQEINWGIIGCGNVTEVKSGPAFSKVPHSRLAAVMRRNGEKARDYAQRHNVPRWYNDAQLLIDDPGVNAIYVATPPASHEEYAIRALRAGKPVYLEKPMATNAASAKRIAAVAKETGVPLSIAHYRRRQPLFLTIKSLIDEGRIGRVQRVSLELFQPHQSPMIATTEENWRLNPALSGGGLFHDLAPHQLDLMIHFFGEHETACGLSCNTGNLYGAPDTTSGQILFRNGVLFHGNWCFVARESTDKCIITGTEGELQFSIFGQAPLVIRQKENMEQQNFEPLTHVQEPMIRDVVAYFRGEMPNPCPADAGVEVMELIDKFSVVK
jgi:predicted dehydrogenase